MREPRAGDKFRRPARPRRGDLVTCVDVLVLFPAWEYDGGDLGRIQPGTLCIFLEERSDPDDEGRTTLFWRDDASDGRVGWAGAAGFVLP